MERIDALLSRKREILKYYREQLERPGISMNPEPKGTVNGAWMPTIVFDRRTGVTTDELLLAFREDRIDARVFFHPLSSLPMFEARGSNRNAYDIAQRALNLPSFHDMTRDHQDRVISIVLQALEKKSTRA
jgi:perosamine synthetase